jgi:L-ribulokinase
MNLLVNRMPMLNLGTSSCVMILSDKMVEVPGICGGGEDIIVSGYAGYEAGQSAFGDHYQWFVENCVPPEYLNKAENEGISIYKLLSNLAKKTIPGESGLLALDWWNGNRSVLVDGKLSGMIVGLTLQTKAEEIYRALLESTAFGTRKILENYKQYGIVVDKMIAAGGIAARDPFLMQMFADVTGVEITLAHSSLVPALSAAILASVAAGEDAGGFASLEEAIKIMVRPGNIKYRPNEKNQKVYNKLYLEYERLHDYFGRGENEVMKRLRNIAKVN